MASVNGLLSTPWAVRISTTACTSSRFPETTVFSGPLAAAIDRAPVGEDAAHGLFSREHGDHRPAGRQLLHEPSACDDELDGLVELHSATQAATISPRLWPRTARGLTPQDCQS